MRTLASLITVLVSSYALLGLILYLMQERMVFLANMPGRALIATPQQLGLEFDDVYFETGDGVTLHGWYVHAREPRGTLLFFHGNAGNISHRLDSIAIFDALGLDTLIIDYRGYGQSDGKPSEAGTYEDAEAAWHYLVTERGVRADNIVVFGRSLGGAVAARLAKRHQPAAVIVESTFTSAVDVARRLYWYFPVRLITRLDYPVVNDLAAAQCPVLVVHSRNDEILPFAMAETLYAAAPEPKSFLELSGDHNMGFLLTGVRYQEELARFIDEHLILAHKQE